MLKYIHVFVATKTKLAKTLESFFLMDGFTKPHRLDRNKNQSEIMISIGDKLQVKF